MMGDQGQGCGTNLATMSRAVNASTGAKITTARKKNNTASVSSLKKRDIFLLHSYRWRGGGPNGGWAGGRDVHDGAPVGVVLTGESKDLSSIPAAASLR